MSQVLVSDKAKSKIISKDNMYYVHSLIGILFMVGFGFIPPIGAITKVGMQVIGIFIGMIYCWTTVGAIWPSIFAIIVLGMTDYSDMNNVVINGYGSTIVVQMFFMMMFIGLVQEEKVSEYIARWFITRKIINGRPWVFSLMFLLGAYTSAALASVIPTLLLFWPIAYSIFKEVGYKPGDKYATLLLLSVVLMVAIGGATAPYKDGAMILLGNFAGMSDRSIDFMKYFSVMVILSLIITIILVLFMKYILRPDVTPLKNINVEMFKKNKLPPMNKKQKLVSIMLIVFIVLMFMPPLVPQSLIIGKMLNKLSSLGIAMIVPAVMCFIKIDGEPVLNFKKIASKYMSWESYFLVAAALIVGNALTNEVTGVTLFLQQILGPIFEGKSILMITILMIVLGMILTNLCNSVVIGMLMLPIVISVTNTLGINPDVMAVITIFSVLALPLIAPPASPYAAMAHANVEWLKAKDIYLYATIIALVVLVCIVAIGIPLIGMFI